MLQHLLWPSLMIRNLLDSFKVVGGLVQSFFKLIVWRPDVVFTKGGYVCLPVGLAAHILKIPLVIHDSDAHPGLTNRVLARYATTIATGSPLEYYAYDPRKSHYVGIPINKAFTPPTAAAQKKAKKAWGVPTDKPLVVVTGGGLGARRLNETVLAEIPALTRIASVILVAGVEPYQEIRKVHPSNTQLFQVYPFTTKMPELLSAADIVVTRAGATTLLELAALAKPTILVPNAALTGGHQLKNAAVYGDARAAVVLNEDEMVENTTLLVNAVKEYLDNPNTMHAVAKRFSKFAKPDAAEHMAKLILSAGMSPAV